MDYEKITNLLGNASHKVPGLITKKWIEVYDQFGETYNTNKQIRFKTSLLRSDLCDYSDAYIVVKGDITVEGANNRDKKNRAFTFKNNAPFISCISKINGSKTSGSLWNYYIDELTDETNDDNGQIKM